MLVDCGCRRWVGMEVEALRLGLKLDQSERSVDKDAIVVPTIESRVAGDPSAATNCYDTDFHNGYYKADRELRWRRSEYSTTVFGIDMNGWFMFMWEFSGNNFGILGYSLIVFGMRKSN
jgi:hypothetical protein